MLYKLDFKLNSSVWRVSWWYIAKETRFWVSDCACARNFCDDVIDKHDQMLTFTPKRLERVGVEHFGS